MLKIRHLAGLIGAVAFTGLTFLPTLAAGNDQVAAGDSHSVAIVNGTIFSWGGNTSGQLGDGTTIAHSIPQRLPGLGGAIAVAAGANHTLVLKSDGSVLSFGANNAGQLGDGSTIAHLIAVPVQGLTNVTAIS